MHHGRSRQEQRHRGGLLPGTGRCARGSRRDRRIPRTRPQVEPSLRWFWPRITIGSRPGPRGHEEARALAIVTYARGRAIVAVALYGNIRSTGA
ncbi:hypothetical protein L1887_54671 [Cichorium endivia]|nr:hypothetical protein L1887_54671 [Cichorium endivia]